MSLQDWRVVAASAIGTSHLNTDAPCQDAFAHDVFQSEGDIVVLIVSDGAGSASHSDRGASLACCELLDSIRSFVDDGGQVAGVSREIAHGWLENASVRIAHQARIDELPVREYACTLLAAIVSAAHVCFVQVGDGAIVIRPRGDDWTYVFWPQHGEYINTTVFLTDPAALANFEFTCREDAIDEVAVFTDGIEALVLHYASQTVHTPFFDNVFRSVRMVPDAGFNVELSEKLAQYLASPVICDRTDDDKTLLLATRLSQPPRRASELAGE
jgi:hypothetical protein